MNDIHYLRLDVRLAPDYSESLMICLRFALPGLRAAAVLMLLGIMTRHTMAAPLGTAFTYQGQLTDGGLPANGSYDLQMSLWDSPTNGHFLSHALLLSGVPITNGFFTTQLDFGDIPFNGDAVWLRVGVKTNGAVTPFKLLTPRQWLSPTPYALWAASAGSTPASAITGTITDSALSSNVVLLSSGGAGLTNVTAARLERSAAAGYAAAWTNNQTLWIDAVYGNDTNSGLTPYAPLQSIARLLAIQPAGYTLRFAPGTYYIQTNSPLVLSNNTAILHGVTISDTFDNNAPGNTSIPCVILINGPATIYGGTIIAQSTNTQDFPIQFNGTYPLTNVVLEGVTTLGYSDGTGMSGAYIWTQPLMLTEKACSHFSYWDCFSIGTAYGAATNSILRFLGCDFTSSAYDAPLPTLPVINRRDQVRGLAFGGGKVHLAGCTIEARGGVNATYGLTCNGVGNPGPQIHLSGTEISVSSTNGGSIFAIRATGYSHFYVDGHPYPDSLLSTYLYGSITFNGQEKVYVAGSTNAPVNTSAPEKWIPVNVGGTEYRVPVYK